MKEYTMYAVYDTDNDLYSVKTLDFLRKDCIKRFFGSKEYYNEVKHLGWAIKKVKVTIEEI